MNPIGLLLDFLFGLLDKVAINWLAKRKLEDAIEAQNKVASMSDATVAGKLRDSYTRK